MAALPPTLLPPLHLQDSPPSSKIVAASGNPIDFKVAQGGLKGAWDCPLPMVMGYDFSGTIVAISTDGADGADPSASFKVGDDVFAVNWGQVSS